MTFVIPTTTEKLRNKLLEACDGISICPRDGQRKLGILFAMPYVAKSQKAHVDEFPDEWLAAVMSVKRSPSWVFPTESRHIAGLSICPGVALLIKEVGPGRVPHFEGKTTE